MNLCACGILFPCMNLWVWVYVSMYESVCMWNSVSMYESECVWVYVSMYESVHVGLCFHV